MSINYHTRTFHGKIIMTLEQQEVLEKIGLAYSSMRNDDYSLLVKNYKTGNSLSNNDRRKYLTKKYNITTREADNIVYSNNEQLELVKRTTKDNIKQWEKDISSYKKKRINLHGYKKHNVDIVIDRLSSRIRKSQEKSPSCCFGSRKLQQYITKHPEDVTAHDLWKRKRMFLDFMGANGRSSGNDSIKIKPETLEVTIRISDGLRKAAHLTDRVHVIGKYNIKYGKEVLMSSISNNTKTTYEFRYKNNKWLLYAITQVDNSIIDKRRNAIMSKSHVKNLDRVCGIDQNSGFVTATIIDKHGNPVNSMTVYHTSSDDLEKVVAKIIKFSLCNGAMSIVGEKLTGLHNKKRKSLGRGAALNNTVNRIPYGSFTRKMLNNAENCGVSYVMVSPYNTSRNTVYWIEDIFGVTVHEKASYLIAREGLGLDTLRRS